MEWEREEGQEDNGKGVERKGRKGGREGEMDRGEEGRRSVGALGGGGNDTSSSNSG